MNRIHLQNMNEMTRTIENIANVVTWHDNGQTDASGNPLTDEDCFTQIRAEVQAYGFLPSDEESDHSDEVSDEEMSEADVGSYCEACARVKRSVAWYHLPFTLPNGFRAYSACAECCSQHGLQDRPESFFA